jgi:hypothetical protein
METGYLSKTKMSEFDRFLPHLKKINHRYPVFELPGRIAQSLSRRRISWGKLLVSG